MFALKSLFLYVLSLVVTVFLFASGHDLFGGRLAIGIVFTAYIISGMLLNRFVLCRVGWHPDDNTQGIVAKDKLTYLLFWPLKYPFLILKLLINTIL